MFSESELHKKTRFLFTAEEKQFLREELGLRGPDGNSDFFQDLETEVSAYFVLEVLRRSGPATPDVVEELKRLGSAATRLRDRIAGADDETWWRVDCAHRDRYGGGARHQDHDAGLSPSGTWASGRWKEQLDSLVETLDFALEHPPAGRRGNPDTRGELIVAVSKVFARHFPGRKARSHSYRSVFPRLVAWLWMCLGFTKWDPDADLEERAKALTKTIQSAFEAEEFEEKN
ncbi:MAG: hypothetical protein ACYDA8_18945 [Deferrisomatales bacterium]